MKTMKKWMAYFLSTALLFTSVINFNPEEVFAEETERAESVSAETVLGEAVLPEEENSQVNQAQVLDKIESMDRGFPEEFSEPIRNLTENRVVENLELGEGGTLQSAQMEEEIHMPAFGAPRESKAPVTNTAGDVGIQSTTSGSADYVFDRNCYPAQPFDFDASLDENISTNSGTLQYKETDVVLPGKNGLDLTIGIKYDSGKAQSVTIEELLKLDGGETVEGRKPFQSSNMLTDFAYGWSFQFSGMEKRKENRNKYFSLADGRTYRYDPDWGLGSLDGNNLLDKEVYEISSSSPEYFTVDGRSTKYVLKYVDGNKDYFDASGYLICMKNRFGNQITFSYGFVSGVNRSVTITDTYGRVTSLERTANGTITVTLPDDSTIVYDADYLLYSKQDVNGKTTFYTHEYNEHMWHAGWRPTCSSWDSMEDTFDSITVEEIATLGWYMNANLTEIEYPTGARTEYTYYSGGSHIHGQDGDGNNVIHTDPSSYQMIPMGLYGFETVAAIETRKDIVNGTICNYKTYSYDDGGLKTYGGKVYTTGSSTNMPSTLTTGYSYDTKMVDHSAGITYEYTFNGKHNKKTETRSSGSNTFYQASYTNYMTSTSAEIYTPLPKNVSITVDGVTTTDAYTYNYKGEVLSHTYTPPGGSSVTESMTYGSNISILTGKTYYKDSGKQIVETYTLNSAGNAVTSAEIKEDGVLKKKSSYTYNDDGTLASQTDFTSETAGITTTYSYTYNLDGTDNYRITKQTGTDTEISTYDERGNLIAHQDARGNTITYQYDASGRVTRETYPDNSYKNYTYYVSSSDTRITEQSETGKATVYHYTPLGQIKSVVKGGISIVSFTYDTAGRLVQEKDGRNTTYDYAYDYLDRILSKEAKNADGVSLARETYSYTGGVSAADPRSGATIKTVKTIKTIEGDSSAPDIKTVSYQDAFGRLIKQGYMEGNTEPVNWDTFHYDYLGNLIQKRNAYDESQNRNYTMQYDTDYTGNVLSAVNAAGQTVTAVYDLLGRKVSRTDAENVTRTYGYDNRGNLIQESIPFANGKNQVKRYTYDGNGNRIQESITNGSETGSGTEETKTTYEYNNRNRLVQVNGYDGDIVKSTISYTYDAAGNLLSKNDGNGTTSYSYDNLNRLVELEDALGQTETYTYDANSNVTQKVDRNGVTINTIYDGLNRAVSVSAVKADGTPAPEFVQTAYSKIGSMIQRQNEALTVTYAYDNRGRNISQQQSNGIQKVYEYNLAGARTSFRLKQGTDVKLSQGYIYDAVGRLTQVTNNGTAVVNYTYNGNNSLLTAVYPASGITSTYTYGTAGQLLSLVNKKGTNTLSSYNYTYYLDGNLASKTDAEGTTSYIYDDLGRLIQESVPGSAVRQYTYDNAGNRLSMTISGNQTENTAYTYDANNRLLKETKTAGDTITVNDYTYDANGNQLTMLQTLYEPGESTLQESAFLTVLGEDETGSGIQAKENTYNVWNQLVAVKTGATAASYTYGPDGLRQSKTVNGQTTTHIWDGDELAAELNSEGTMTARYLQGNNLAASLDNTGAIQYYLYNGHGDVTGLTDGSGIVTKTYAYDAFGNEINPGEADTNPFRYCGEYFDGETGSIYLRARYYDPAISRMLSEDTHWNPGNMIYGDRKYRLGEKRIPDINAIIQSSNLYVYCGNNPLKYIDPTGESYTNSIVDNGNENFTITTNMNVLCTDLKFEYTISNGVVRFDFSKNDYWAVLWRGGGKELAEAAYTAAKSISSDYLSGRTVGGLNTEIQLHWVAYVVGIKKENARVADAGGMNNQKPGYDSNAWFFQGAQAGKILTKLNIFKPSGIKALLNEIGEYFE